MPLLCTRDALSRVLDHVKHVRDDGQHFMPYHAGVLCYHLTASVMSRAETNGAEGGGDASAVAAMEVSCGQIWRHM